jgi:hypothetical protein
MHSVVCLRQIRSLSESELSTECFLFKFPITFLLFTLIQELLTPSSSSSLHFYPPLYLSLKNRFKRQFLRNMWPIQLDIFLLFVGYICFSWLSVIILRFSHDLSDWSTSSFSKTTFQLYRYFWYTFRNVRPSTPYKTMLQMYDFTSFFHKFKTNMLVKGYFCVY